MNELVLYFSRSLLYGAVMGAIITYIFSLGFAFKNVTSKNGRFVFGLSIIGMLWLLMQYFVWFIVDTYDLLGVPKVSGTINFIEIGTVIFFGIPIYCISKLKPIRKTTVGLIIAPLLLLAAAFLITGLELLIWLGFAYLAIFIVSMCVLVSRNIIRYQTLLNETYANTSMRGVAWLRSLHYPMMSIVVVWVVLGVLYPSSLSDCIYMIFSIILWGFYVNRLRRQNFNVKVMEEIEESGENEEAEETDDDLDVVEAEGERPAVVDGAEPAANEQDIPKPDLPAVAVKLKAWQEPRFAAAVEAFCHNEENYTNSDLSVQDVANGVGTNRTYVSKWFKEQGTDFSSYMINIRLEYAERLLVNTDKPIIEIVELSGFGNARHFRTTFAARYGCPPSEYRANKAQ